MTAFNNIPMDFYSGKVDKTFLHKNKQSKQVTDTNFFKKLPEASSTKCPQQSDLVYSDDDVDMTSFQIPKDFDVDKVVEAITIVSFIKP